MASDFNSRVRVRLYELFVKTGKCPPREELAGDLRSSIDDIDNAFKELADGHMLVLQPGSGEVLMANPLSSVPTPFVVETSGPNGARSWYGNCIWDALGVIAMLQGDGRVLASCGCCGESMSVSVRQGKVACEPSTLRFRRATGGTTSSSIEKPCSSSGRKITLIAGPRHGDCRGVRF